MLNIFKNNKLLIKIFCSLSLTLLAGVTSGQIINNTYLKNDSGIFIVCPQNFLNDINGTIQNNGTILLEGNLTNNSTLNSGNSSTIKLNGNFQQIEGTSNPAFNNLIIDGTGNKFIIVDCFISDSLDFQSNKLIIQNNNLFLLQNAIVTNSSAQKFIVTNGTGFVIKKQLQLLNDFLFPIGDTLDSYKPVIFNYSGIPDTFAVRVQKGINPTTGTDQNCVQNTWIIEEGVAGGTNASISLGWNSIDEGSFFIDSVASIWQFSGGQWSSIPGTVGSISNLPSTDWFHVSSGITDFSNSSNKFIMRTFPVPSIINQPVNETLCSGEIAYFNVFASGMGIISYQWQENCGNGWSDINDNSIYSGAQTNSLSISNCTQINSNCSYQCIVSNDGGLIISDSVILIINPTYNNTVNVSTCQGQSYYLPDSTIITQSGVYTTTLNSINNCDSIITTDIIFNPIPQINAGQDTSICQGQSITLFATGGNQYSWDHSVVNGIPFTPDTTATYHVTVSDQNNCQATDSITITINSNSIAPVSITASQNPVCENTPVTLSINGGALGTGAAYIWFENNCGNNQIDTGSVIIITPNSATTYFVRAEGTCNITSCSSIEIIVNSNIAISNTISADQTNICSGTQVTFYSSSVNEGSLPLYQWYINNIGISGANDSAFVTSSLSDGDIIYCILYSDTTCTVNNPDTSNLVTITVTTGLMASVSVSSNPQLPVCNGIPVSFEAHPVNGGSNPQIKWFVNNLEIDTGISFNPIYLNNNDIIYCELFSSQNCINNNSTISETIKINYNPLPEFNPEIIPESCMNSGDASISLNIGNGTPPYSVIWSTGQNEENILNLNNGTYNVTVTDSKSCSIDTTINITSNDIGCLYVPNAFSPNSDGNNDILFIRGGNIESLDFKIFDRWGNCVFETTDQNKGWDGTFNGKNLNTGTFIYYLKVKIISKEIQELQGSILLIK